MSREASRVPFTRRTLLGAAAASALGRSVPDPGGPEASLGRSSSPPTSGLSELWVIPHSPLKPAEQLLALTLQGLVGRKQPRIWLRSGSIYAVVEEQLRREGVRLREASSVWELLRQFRGEVKGAILCELDTPSINAATSLCGLRDAVAIDVSLRERAKAEGLKLL